MPFWKSRKSSGKTVLVVCTANMTRSPYFAALLEHKIREKRGGLPKGFTIESAGVNAADGGTAHMVIVNVAQARGLDLRQHRSARFSSSHASNADLILTMEKQHKDKLLKEYPQLEGKVHTVLEYGRLGETPETLDIEDPTGLEVEDYLEYRDIAEKEADRIVHHLIRMGFFED
jgi:protein-tyrosine phosphatase